MCLAIQTAACAIVITMAFAAPAGAELTEGRRLAAAYDAILTARFEDAANAIARACPPAPAEACLALGVVNLWWQIQLNPDSRALDARLEQAAAAAIAAAERWTVRDPQRGEAWFYLAGARAPLVQWRVLRGQRLGAARDGARIKAALEQALALDPSLDDAHFGVGVYRYYADVVSTGARMLRMLLFLPGGNRADGLRGMQQALDRGILLQGEAAYQLHWVYLWYEHQPARALELLTGLRRRYPGNPIFQRRIAEVQHEYFHDHPASAASWETLRQAAERGAVPEPAPVLTAARLGLAEELIELLEPDRAIEQLDAVLGATPVPPAAAARAHLNRGRALDATGDRSSAVLAYQHALRHATSSESSRIIAQARQGIATPPDPRATDAARHALGSRRALERGDVDAAIRLARQAIARAPDDPTARYRLARALIARGDASGARDHLEFVVQPRTAAPPIVLAAALFDLASLLDASDKRDRARDLYRRARDLVGGALDVRQQAADAVPD